MAYGDSLENCSPAREAQVRILHPPLMKIHICGSMTFYKEMRVIRSKLQEIGHSVTVPMETDETIPVEARKDLTSAELITAKIEYDFIRKNFRKIEDAEAILILNYQNKGIEGYVGGNTFLEMGYAFGLRKKVFALYQVPDMDYASEMHAMQPIVINNDLTKIR